MDFVTLFHSDVEKKKLLKKSIVFVRERKRVREKFGGFEFLKAVNVSWELK